MKSLVINNNSYCPTFNDIKHENLDSDKTYQKIYNNKTSNKRD